MYAVRTVKTPLNETVQIFEHLLYEDWDERTIWGIAIQVIAS